MEVIELPGLVVRTVAVGGMNTNVYLLTAASGDQLLIDAAAEPDAIGALRGAAAGDGADPWLRLVLTTHAHHDHRGALAAVTGAHPEAETLAGAADADEITSATGVPIGRPLGQGDVVELGGVSLTILALRGHTPGSVAVACVRPGVPAHLFVGDALFPGGVGRTRNDVDFRSLLADVSERVFEVYPDDTVVWPGHGLPTTLGAERPHLDEWRRRGW